MAPSKTLKQRANPSQLGDPVSLKAETSNTQPTEHDKPNKSTDKQPSLKQMAEKDLEKDEAGGRSQLGDPVSLKAETSDSEPTEEDRGVRGTTKTGRSKL